MVDEIHYVSITGHISSIFYGPSHTIIRSLIIFGDNQNAGIGK